MIQGEIHLKMPPIFRCTTGYLKMVGPSLDAKIHLLPKRHGAEAAVGAPACLTAHGLQPRPGSLAG